MDFSLSSSLVGNAVSNPDKLALNLQFATDKTLTARKGPTPVFTRASGATFVDSDKLVKYAPENLVLQSEDFSTTWARTGIKAFGSGSIINTTLTTDPFGLNNAELIQGPDIAAPAYLSQTFTVVSLPAQMTASVYLKAGTSNWAIIEAFGSFCYYNLSGSGSTGVTSGLPTVSITSLPNGWYRCALSRESSTSSIRIYVAESNTVLNTTKNLFVYGCQVERSNTARTYNPTTTAAFYGPRFDHDPVTGVCKGLLIEEARTNNVYNSNLLTSASWSLVGATNATSDTAPDGSAAFEITETSVTSGHSISNSGGATGAIATSITSGVIYTLSVFAKQSTGSVDWIQLTGTGPAFGTAQYANFNLATGATGNSAGLTSGTTSKIEPFPNGWYRCSMTVTATATTVGNSISINLTNNTNTTTRVPSYLGSTANKVKLAMGQFEAGSFATSYIPNVGSSGVTRSADVCSITGSAFSGFYNASQGSLFANSFTPANGQRTIVAFDDNTANEMIRLRTEGTDPFYRVTDGGVDVVALDAGTIASNTSFRFASTYAVNNFAATVNGGSMSTSTSGTLPTVDRMRIGTGQAGNTICGCISSVKYFQKRLTNTKLQAIT